MLRVACVGNGVDSTAALLMNSDYDVLIHAVTGDDWPENYEHMKKLEAKIGKKIILAFPRLGSIREHSRKTNTVPLVMDKKCADHFKKRPQRQTLQELYPNEQIEFNIFYASDEFRDSQEKVVKPTKSGHINWKKRKYWYRYPLVEAGFDTPTLKQYCLDKMGYIPPKSACMLCPNASLAQKIRLSRKHPDVFKDTILLYKNSKVRDPSLKKFMNFKQTSEIVCGCYRV